MRTDLHAPGAIDPEALARVMPLLVSERGKPLPAAWVQAAWRVDRDVERAQDMDAPPGETARVAPRGGAADDGGGAEALVPPHPRGCVW